MTGAFGAMCVNARLQPSQTASAVEHDRRQKARAANDGDAASSAEALAKAEGEGDMFTRAGVAAE